MSFKFLSTFFIIYIVIIFSISSFFTPILFADTNVLDFQSDSEISKNISSKDFIWPIPGYTRISSKFGKRNVPTAGASSFHQGIDIPAPAGTILVAPTNSKVTYIGFNGSAGYSIHLKSNNFEFFYHHVSPNYIVSKGDFVSAGKTIGNVGPKNVYNVKNNPYKDSSGKPTNGSTTGPHLHFTIKKDGKAVNPLDFY